MEDDFIVDTSLLVYAFDLSEKEKREKCFDLVKNIFKGGGKGYVTNQILGELFFVLTKKMEKPSKREDAEIIVNSLIDSNNWGKINYDYFTIKKAIELEKNFNIGFWDAVIIATMLENNIFTVYTENVKDFSKVGLIKVINPLR